MKVGVNMAGKRPYYVITYTRDCDGYDSYLTYIGTNWKAAYQRYLSLIEYIKQREFIDYGANEDELNIDIRRTDTPLRVGNDIYSYINNDDNCWISICLKCVNTHKFLDSGYEARYKNQFPNSKY